MNRIRFLTPQGIPRDDRRGNLVQPVFWDLDAFLPQAGGWSMTTSVSSTGGGVAIEQHGYSNILRCQRQRVRSCAPSAVP